MKEALEYLEKNPGISTRKVAQMFNVSKTTLQRRVKTPLKSTLQKKRNTLLTDIEEKALCAYIDRLDRINLAVRVEFVCDAANSMLRERLKDTTTALVKPHWVTRFLRRHGYAAKTQKMLDMKRKDAESVEVITEYFQQLEEVIKSDGILPEDTWNMDETGFRIGMKSNAVVITKRKRAHYFALPQNRESATAIEAISAGGCVIPLFLILSGRTHSSSWYQEHVNLHPQSRVAVVETGYSNDELALEWIQHFNEHSRKGQLGAKRLLIVDGHGSHHTAQFIQYCDDNNIIPFGMPSNLTHLLQPLDVCIFQPYKHYHGLALDRLVRDGAVQISKIEFLSIIEDIRNQAFKEATIKSAFRKSGIHPLNSSEIVKDIITRQPYHTPTPPPYASSSDPNTPTTYRQLNKAASKIDDIIANDLAVSPANAELLGRFVKGALFSAATGMQLQRDLSRTRYAEAVRSQRRNAKRQQLQAGGVLKVAEARHMIEKRSQSDIIAAEQLLERHAKKQHNHAKKTFKAAAKKARDWRRSGTLSKLENYTEIARVPRYSWY